jgi:hypothetical protein
MPVRRNHSTRVSIRVRVEAPHTERRMSFVARSPGAMPDNVRQARQIRMQSVKGR